MEWMSDWIRQIILIIFIATFIDLLLPSSSLERYVKLIMGLIIIVSILQPVFQLVLNDDKWSKFSALFAPALSNDQDISFEKINENTTRLTHIQQEEIKKQFQDSIVSWIEKQVEKKYHVKVVSAKVTAEITNDTPVIHKIEVQGIKQQSNSSAEVVKPIEPVEIRNERMQSNTPKQDTKMQHDVQYFIGDTWNIDTRQISVQIHSPQVGVK